MRGSLCANLFGQLHNIKCLALRVSHDPWSRPYFKAELPPHTYSSEGEGRQCKGCRGLLVSSACDVIKSVFHLQMSASSESDSSNRHGCDSDGELSVASSYGSEVKDCRKRPRHPQIIANSWVLLGQITMDQLHADSDSMAAGPEGDAENEDRILIYTRRQGLFGAQFEILFGKLHGNVVYFVVFCNLINILDVGADSSDAVKMKIEIRGFLQLRKPRAVTALQNCSPRSPLLFLAVGSGV